MKKNLVQEYLNVVFNYGGFLASRREIIVDMTEKGYDRKSIDYYLMGLDRNQPQDR
jgi:hypothetical protein